jgi:transcriptional regulator with XRE-family HTH domain
VHGHGISEPSCGRPTLHVDQCAEEQVQVSLFRYDTERIRYPVNVVDRLVQPHPLEDLEPGHLIRWARERAGLSQADLARAVNTTQSAVSRWEMGRDEPRRSRLAELLDACGFRATLTVVPADDGVDRAQLRQQLAMSPEQRLASVANVSRFRATARRA